MADANLRLVAVCGGGDWLDASFNHVLVPPTMDLGVEYSAWRRWLTENYYPALKAHRPGAKTRVEFLDFVEWLIVHRGCSKGDVEEFWEGP